ncbi:MAG: hypothetical protein NVS3B25_04720 [Hymenobacter sp.]
MTRFAGKAAIVTGAGQGIGFEIARQLAREGAHVLLNDMDSDLLVKASERIQSEAAGSCWALAGDAADMADQPVWPPRHRRCQRGNYALRRFSHL